MISRIPTSRESRHQDTGRAFDQVNPEVADRLGRFSGHGLKDAGQCRHAAGCRDELEQHDDEQLRKIAQARFPAVVLQVAVDHEADAGVERQIGTLARITVGIQRQDTL